MIIHSPPLASNANRKCTPVVVLLEKRCLPLKCDTQFPVPTFLKVSSYTYHKLAFVHFWKSNSSSMPFAREFDSDTNCSSLTLQKFRNFIILLGNAGNYKEDNELLKSYTQRKLSSQMQILDAIPIYIIFPRHEVEGCVICQYDFPTTKKQMK